MRGPAWVSQMTTTLGRAGRIVELDMSQQKNPLMMLEFYDSESLRLTRWCFIKLYAHLHHSLLISAKLMTYLASHPKN